MTTHCYKYKVLKSTWGISIEIQGTYLEQSKRPDIDKTTITSGLWLSVNANLVTRNRRKSLETGVSLYRKESHHSIPHLRMIHYFKSKISFLHTVIIK